jgi:glycine/D-amino acid oxidase-like deaminating enzyme
MEIRNLPKDPGPAGWNAILPDEPPKPVLGGRTTADWLVIGAGFAGLAAARRLRQHRPGDRIAVLEATRVGHGPAGRNTGFMIDLPHDLQSDGYGGSLEADRRRTAMNRAAIAFAEDAAGEYGLSAEAFARSGKVNAAATEKGLRHNGDYSRHLAALGEPHEMLDAAAMTALTGTDYYVGGLFTPGAAMIQPALFVRGVAHGLASNRTTIWENSPVVALEPGAGGWTARTPGGAVTAPKAVLAVNGHAESFGFFRRRLLHVFTYASMTRALTSDEVAALGGRPFWACTPADPMGTTVRRIAGTGGHRIVVRNRFTYDPSMQVDDARIAAVAHDHDRAFRARFPMLAGVGMEYRWGGRLCLSRNDVPAFGEVAEGLYSACCCNGLGTARGTLAGMLAADLATGASSDLLDRMLAEQLPSRLPPEPIAWVGATARIRWSERMAGREL